MGRKRPTMSKKKHGQEKVILDSVYMALKSCGDMFLANKSPAGKIFPVLILHVVKDSTTEPVLLSKRFLDLGSTSKLNSRDIMEKRHETPEKTPPNEIRQNTEFIVIGMPGIGSTRLFEIGREVGRSNLSIDVVCLARESEETEILNMTDKKGFDNFLVVSYRTSKSIAGAVGIPVRYIDDGVSMEVEDGVWVEDTNYGEKSKLRLEMVDSFWEGYKDGLAEHALKNNRNWC